VINRLQDGIQQQLIHLTLAAAQEIENIFGRVTEVDHRPEVEEPGTAFNRVERPEDGVEQVLIIRTLLHLDQLFTQFFDELACFHHKVGKDFVAGVGVHVRL